MVLDGAAIAARAGAEAPEDLRALLLAFFPAEEIPPMAEADDGAAPLPAEVNHGTWIAPCACGAEGLPAPGCLVWLCRPWGWCVRCRNAGAGGRWRPIALPSNRAAIEAVLAARPDVEHRNWLPGETVDDLIRENAAHGLEAATPPVSDAGLRVSGAGARPRNPQPETRNRERSER